jgi:Leucine-rich repeat (LRR) protein
MKNKTTNICMFLTIIIFFSMTTVISQTLIIENDFDLNNLTEKLNKNDSTYLNIDTLIIRFFYINSIPKEISVLKKIRYLKIFGCGLDYIDEVVFSLKTLEHLNLQNNKIKRIPTSIRKLKKIKYLNLGNTICHLCVAEKII